MNLVNGKGQADCNGSGVPKHVAIIMDGNGRWAEKRGLERNEGHVAGWKTAHKIVTRARELGVRYLSLFAFSTENWKRPEVEVEGLMQLFHLAIKAELPTMLENEVRLRLVGDKSKLSDKLRSEFEDTEDQTREMKGMDLVLAVSYGGREDILAATRSLAGKAARGECDPEEIDVDAFSSELYTRDVPDPDLLIRTSGESRISNFFLWQIAYSEIIVTDTLWPDFSEERFEECLGAFSQRDRRFGLSPEQFSSRTG